jgi:PQQ-dependent catabolism-associated CXXCW motif protein
MRMRQPRHLAVWAVTSVLLIATQGTGTAADVPEPDSFWMGPMQGDVPASLAHGQVIGTQALADLMARGTPLLIDVAGRPQRPANLAPEAIWKPAPHRDIPGSVWLPGLGAGKLDPPLDHFFEARLVQLTDGDRDRAIVFYCHPHCWASWNAAKRATGYNYRNVFWYREGVEGWLESGRDLATAADESPPAPAQTQ